MRRSTLLALASLPILLGAAGRKPTLQLAMAFPVITPAGPAVAAHPAYQPAPMPNPDAGIVSAPAEPAKSHFGPAVFAASHKQFRGDGFTADSTEQVEQERNYKPGGGLALKLPLQ